jgi:hypothetical protein
MAFVLWLATAGTGAGRIITVDDDGPADFNNIQVALYAASHGDVVEVRLGTYTGPGNRDIDFLGKAITVRSTDPNDPNVVAATIIDCNGSHDDPHRGFHFHRGEHRNSIVDGLTITNGYAPWQEWCDPFWGCFDVGEPGGGVYCLDAGPTIRNSVITGNTTLREGGGIFGSEGPIINCRITYNAARRGGGLHNCSGPIINCDVSNNTASYGGGGIYNVYDSLVLTNCILSGNSAVIGGGAVHLVSGHLTDCIISGNHCDWAGAGILAAGGDVTITNCVVSYNSASSWGAGGVGGSGASFTITNCILWGNKGPTGPQMGIDLGSQLWVSYSDVQGGLAEVYVEPGDVVYWGNDNIDADPQFVQPGYWADANDPNVLVEPNDPNSAWIEGDYHVLQGSPCTDVGDNNALPADIADLDGDGNTVELIPWDLDGKPRIVNGRVDMGVYEHGFYIGDPNLKAAIEAALGVSEPNEADMLSLMRLDANDRGIVELTGLEFARSLSEVDLEDNEISRIWALSRLADLRVVDLSGNKISDISDISALTNLTLLDLRGNPLSVESRKTYLPMILANNLGIDLLFDGRVLYVDCDANGINDGTSWENAFSYLQDALAAAVYGDQILVAEGVYKPDCNTADPCGSGDRTATFSLIEAVQIKGGHAGIGAEDPNLQDAALCETILSGDLNGDDGPGFANNDENSYYVVSANSISDKTVLEGLTVAAGNANDRRAGYYKGGGIHALSSSLTVTNCTLHLNFGLWGGGVYDLNGSPIFVNCVFSGNLAVVGGAMLSDSGSPALRNCTVTGNYGSTVGGVLAREGARPVLSNCILWGNKDSGGVNESAQVYGLAQLVNYCCIQGWTGGLGGVGNMGDDPCFVEPGYWDSNGLWVDGDYHLLTGSPCIDTGDPNYVPVPNETDLDGKPRVLGGRIDMGAYEFVPAIECRVAFLPRVINRHSRAKRIMAFMLLPEGVTKDQIDSSQRFMLYPGGVEAERQMILPHSPRHTRRTMVICFFERDALLAAVPDDGRAQLRLAGSLNDGRRCCGSGTVWIRSSGRLERFWRPWQRGRR